jgi:hypothetical protein
VSINSSEEPSLEHRRLRFSFQINDFKDQDQKIQPHRLTPVNGGGGDICAPSFHVKQFFVKEKLLLMRPSGETLLSAGVASLKTSTPPVNRNLSVSTTPSPKTAAAISATLRRLKLLWGGAVLIRPERGDYVEPFESATGF